ncbi:selenide, water dikinase SelD [Prochlorococcus sp. MIT 1300]|uniref:selenide, water dikinase SelD n=1 Tax=Prochlorococcus sp. MIT 1300 TaxID=3096218 RepID=UPI002A74A429|nr:selenide, water dikinase SelD [Prochlorococcus sp. MIT 1300]
MRPKHLVLAGGGHTHALILARWIMHPELRPGGLITLVSSFSTTLYSGMVPGLVAGRYRRDQVEIDIRSLADRAGVAFIKGEIIGLDVKKYRLLISGRNPISFNRISLDVGNQTAIKLDLMQVKNPSSIKPIKPLEAALEWLESYDDFIETAPNDCFNVVGSGLSGVEIAFALRQRWRNQKIKLHVKHNSLRSSFGKALSAAGIEVIENASFLQGPALICTGGEAQKWIAMSGLPVSDLGRIITSKTLQVIGHPHFFAAGDCSVIDKCLRPASGVWAVRAAIPLARNLERCSLDKRPLKWTPQRRSLHLIGGQLGCKKPLAWAIWGGMLFGPNKIFWLWKRFIDQRFVDRFKRLLTMRKKFRSGNSEMGCRGCAAKIASRTLQASLVETGLKELATFPEDAAYIDINSTGESLLQSVDGFPALISDPWLNGRLTGLHACSDLWASGASVKSAQPVITLPIVSGEIQQYLLSQTLAGIQSALDNQGAKLLGGHTLEARHPSPSPCSIGINVALSVNGSVKKGFKPWSKGGLQEGDSLFISRGIGSGVIFAAAMQSVIGSREYLDFAISELSNSQHDLVIELQELSLQCKDLDLVHACTDVTGFGLLGHLGEMLTTTNKKRELFHHQPLRIILKMESIPSIPGAIELLESGWKSTLAPSNRLASRFLTEANIGDSSIRLEFDKVVSGSKREMALHELLFDPQTCGPLLISCPQSLSEKIKQLNAWTRIGFVL